MARFSSSKAGRSSISSIVLSVSERYTKRSKRETERVFLERESERGSNSPRIDTAEERDEDKQERKKQERDRESFLGAREKKGLTLLAVTQQKRERDLESDVTYNWEERNIHSELQVPDITIELHRRRRLRRWWQRWHTTRHHRSPLSCTITRMICSVVTVAVKTDTGEQPFNVSRKRRYNATLSSGGKM
jgi:hypothetical protein